MNLIEASYLVCTYLIVQDGEIHSNELTLQSKLFKNITEFAIEESKRILSDEEKKVTVNELTNLIKNDSEYNKELLIKNLYLIALSDFYLNSKESDFIKNIADKINFNIREVENYQKEFEKEINEKYTEKKQSLFNNTKERVSKILYQISDKNELFEGNLLEGKEFVIKIKNIAERAYNDLDLATIKMQLLNSTLTENFKKLEDASNKINISKRHDKEAESLIDFIKNLNDNVKNEIKESLEKNIEILNKKSYTVDFFTIAFLGRTKAGKSTFHKVITKEQTDDIGVGKLRTTRYNRTFNWENIRIIDTPGIGAPGGKDDTETARGIIDEADLVCYIVTNDAIQETEFNFLKELKEKNKPLFIILNCKENLEHPIRLKKFLENPLAWKDQKGDKSIKGHIDRIKEMISKNYNSDLIEIIPIQLLAAKLANEKMNNESKSNIKKLLIGSNIIEYNKKIKQTIFRTGHLKKTQNIVDGCNYQANLIYKNSENELSHLTTLIKNLKQQKFNLNLFINEELAKTEKRIKTIINNTHNLIRTDLKVFAVNNYESKDIGKSFKEFLESKGYYEHMKINLGAEIINFQKKLSNRLEESMQDLVMNISSLGVGNIIVDTTDYKFGVNIVFGVIGIFALFSNPAGWVILAITGVGFVVNWLLDSKDTRIKKAIDKIINQISPKINEQEQKITQDVIVEFTKGIQSLQGNLNKNFNGMIKGAEEIQDTLTDINKTASKNIMFFNKLLVYRILEHQKKLKENLKLTELDINEALSNIIIDRQAENLKIKSHLSITKGEQEEISKTLQLNIEYLK